MDTKELQRKMYGPHSPSIAQRITLALLVGASVAIAAWILSGGLETVGLIFGRRWDVGDEVRRWSLGTMMSIYFVRLLFTEFVFLKRGVSWSEVFTIAAWVLFIFVLLSMTGGMNATPFGLVGTAAIVLFIIGSWMNSYAEYTRNVWKRRTENRGHLYTEGLFRYSRHPNYLGDLISFSGLCLAAGSWITIVIPLTMLAGFVFVNIPVLDSHLSDKYGAEFDEYARRTSKLIPSIY